MKKVQRLLGALVLACLPVAASGSAFVSAPQQQASAVQQQQAASSSAAKSKQSKKKNAHHKHSSQYYKNSSGKEVHRPEKASAVPAGATAQCRDGSYSFSQHRRGTCSHHGGVATWLNQ